MARGVARRAELAPEARRLRAEGLTFREIGERLGVGLRTAHEWSVALDESEDEVREACEQLRLSGSAWVMFGWRYAA